MLTTSHPACNILTDLLAAHGVTNAVMSPGSRNAPLIVAMARRPEIGTYVVIDERSAGFVALGMALQLGEPVALVCTSGTALLNYAPAVAEAFYRRVPLVVVSADRPEEWIDQDDSQTLWQQDALAPYVKRSADIQAHLLTPGDLWRTERVINDALLEAVNGRRGPVHLNIRLDAPLNSLADVTPGITRVVTMTQPGGELPTAEARMLGTLLASPRKVLIIAGFHEPDSRLNRALSRLAALPNVAVMTESVSNLHSPLFVSRIDSTLCRLTPAEREAMSPDVVLTLGGALISRHVKEWLRSLPGSVEHWHVDLSHTTVDCFKHLTRRIEMVPAIFFRQLASAMQPHRRPCGYAAAWQQMARRAAAMHDAKVAAAPWSDLKALAEVFKAIPPRVNLHLSNGTPIRYAQLFDCSAIHRCECNRGVSGIDGCASTALGASLAWHGTTLLITGDMSMQYDLAALSSTLLSPRLKIIVMVNGGGSIFRFISSTSSLPELESYFAVGTRLPLPDLCRGYGIDYHEAATMRQLRDALPHFFAPSTRPALLAISTDPTITAETLRDYFD